MSMQPHDIEELKRRVAEEQQRFKTKYEIAESLSNKTMKVVSFGDIILKLLFWIAILLVVYVFSKNWF